MTGPGAPMLLRLLAAIAAGDMTPLAAWDAATLALALAVARERELVEPERLELTPHGCFWASEQLAPFLPLLGRLAPAARPRPRPPVRALDGREQRQQEMGDA